MKKIAIIFCIALFSTMALSANFKKVTVTSASQVQIPNTKKKTVKAIMYNVSPKLALDKMPSKERVQTFINLMLPSVLIAKQLVQEDKIFVKKNMKAYTKNKLSKKNRQRMDTLLQDYKIKNSNFKQLMNRLNTPPVDLVLAQAGLESGWGTSRFFKLGNNAFGIHSFKANEPRIQSAKNKNVYSKKFSSLEECIAFYMRNLVVNQSYTKFAQALNTGQANNTKYLLKHLDAYSELSEKKYTDMIMGVIKKNKLNQYNQYKLM